MSGGSGERLKATETGDDEGRGRTKSKRRQELGTDQRRETTGKRPVGKDD